MLNPLCWDTRPNPSQTSNPSRVRRSFWIAKMINLPTLVNRVAKITLNRFLGTVSSDSSR